MKRIQNRFIILIVLLVIYILISVLLFPNYFFGINLALNVIQHFSKLNYEGNTITYLLENTFATLQRFCISTILVVVFAHLLIFVFHRWKWSLMFLDHFSESLRTVPATAWAYPLAMLPIIFFDNNWAMFISIILSTTPVLTLGLYKLFMEVYNSNLYKLSINNGIKKNNIINYYFIPWLLRRSVVHLKTTVSLIFIIVVVLEDILKGSPITNGLGIIMGNLYGASFDTSSRVAAGIFILVILSFISVSISTLIDLLNEITKGDLNE